MNTKKAYVAPAVKEYEMGAMSIFAGSAAMQKGHARHQMDKGGIWADSE